MIHEGSENGFISRAQAVWKADSKGDRCYRINEETFEKWVTDRLLPNIPSNSIIVMNNTFCNKYVTLTVTLFLRVAYNVKTPFKFKLLTT